MPKIHTSIALAVCLVLGDFVGTARGEITFDEALKQAQIDQKPMLVVFGAQWCSWCRKLEAELSKEEAGELKSKWVIAKVDVDNDPDLAERFQASALPSLRILRTDQTLVAGREGYLPLDELEAWLSEHLTDADPLVQRVLYEDKTLANDDVEELITFLSDRAISVRQAAEARLEKGRKQTQNAVVDVLRTGRLAQQLAAASILKRWEAPVRGIDPWVPESINEESLSPLLEWLREQKPSGDASESDSEESEDRSYTVEEMNSAVSKLILANESTAISAMGTVVGMGMPVLADLKLRLADVEGLSDQQRQMLREAMYKILAGSKLKLENSSLLTALAELDADTHRQAAIELLKHVNSQDQPLVDLLSEDSDPLIREATVGKLEKIGAMKDPDRLRRLLSDPSPSVRTAALRSVSENPRDPLVDTLIEYLGTESDEDLLVYATKTLGQLSASSRAEEALTGLVKNEAWRVRAAALDAIKEKLEKLRSNILYSSYGSPSTSNVSAEIANAVLERTKDEDEFVAEKAVQLIPKIISKDSAEAVCNYLLEFPEKLPKMWADLSPYEKSKLFKPIVDFVADGWITDSDAGKVRLAARILEEFDNNKLQQQIKNLLSSEDQKTRLIGARAFVSLVRTERNERLNLNDAIGAGPKRLASTNNDDYRPWHIAPDSFQVLPKPAPAASSSSQGDSTGTQEAVDVLQAQTESSVDASLDALSDLFGGQPAAIPQEPDGVPVRSTSENPSEVEILDEPATIDKTDTDDDIDAALDLFGEPVESPKPSLLDLFSNVELKSSNASKGTPQTFRKSVWLSTWQQPDAKRPRWMEGCHEIISTNCLALERKNGDAPLSVEEQVELHWMQLAKLASGDVSIAEQLLHAIGHGDPPIDSSGPTMFDIWPWIPASMHRQMIESLNFDWTKENFSTRASQLDLLTDVDDLDFAEWLLDGIAVNGKHQSLDMSAITRLLRRAILGTAGSDEASYYQLSDMLASESAFRNVESNLTKVPDVKDAIKWMKEKYFQTDDANVRASLLTTLDHFAHDLAAESAVGIVCEAKETSPLLDSALSIALSDYTEASADRAVQWLSHPLETVRSKSIERLLTTGADFASTQRPSGIKIFLDYSDAMPAYWHVHRKVPKETLQGLIETTNDTGGGRVKLLVHALGGDAFDILQELDESIPAMDRAIAVAKAGGNDEAAIEVFRAAADETDQPSLLYRAIRNLDGEPVRKYRSELRDKFGSSILEQL